MAQPFRRWLEGIRSGKTELRLLPLFMASAGHVDKDIKPLVAELAESSPGMLS